MACVNSALDSAQTAVDSQNYPDEYDNFGDPGRNALERDGIFETYFFAGISGMGAIYSDCAWIATHPVAWLILEATVGAWTVQVESPVIERVSLDLDVYGVRRDIPSAYMTLECFPDVFRLETEPLAERRRTGPVPERRF